MEEKIKCPYCGRDAEWVENKEVYGRNMGDSHMMWLCRVCMAYVGCHKNSKSPLGTMADRTTRMSRMRAHKYVDGIWKEGLISKSNLYVKISEILGVNKFLIGNCSTEECGRAIDFAVIFRKNLEAGKKMIKKND